MSWLISSFSKTSKQGLRILPLCKSSNTRFFVSTEVRIFRSNFNSPLKTTSATPKPSNEKNLRSRCLFWYFYRHFRPKNAAPLWRQYNGEKALGYAQQALKLANNRNDPVLLDGNVYSYHRNTIEAFTAYQNANGYFNKNPQVRKGQRQAPGQPH